MLLATILSLSPGIVAANAGVSSSFVAPHLPPQLANNPIVSAAARRKNRMLNFDPVDARTVPPLSSSSSSSSENAVECAPLQQSADPSARYRTSRRRSFLSSLLFGVVPLNLVPAPAWAAKGAAEYDFEYYMRDLFMGNKPEGNLPASNAPPPHPPRNLQGPLPVLLLDDELQSCITIQELAKVTSIPISTLVEQIKSFRSKVQPAFLQTHPWKVESVSDEYYFDLTCYSLWRVASAALPKDYARRDVFVRNIGRRLLDQIVGRELISNESINTLLQPKNGPLRLADTTPCIVEILNLFQSSNYCTGYRLGDKKDEERTGLNVFDRFDDEELLLGGGEMGGGSVDCLVSVFDPSTLGGALQITGEGSRFAPDFVGPTLAAVWECIGGEGRKGGGDNDKGNVAISFESYFVDPVYRPNPKDFFPNERLYQFTIARK